MPRAEPIANRRVIEVRDPRRDRINQVADPGHLVELDLRHLVGVRVVVGMQSGRKEDDRNPLRRIAVVIAPVVHLFQVGGIVHLVIERERLWF